jgi:signal transduction histidine kinase
MDLDTLDHPVAAALRGGTPQMLGQNGRRRTVLPPPLDRGRVVPLPGRGDQSTLAGVLVLAGLTPVGQEVRWLARLLGPRIAELRASEGDRRLAAGRALLLAIVNAVTDPILLTDREGRILIANSRAEALLASTENESEGRRRAIALNNMLFSSALWQRAIETGEPSRHELLLVDPSEGSDLLFELLSTGLGEGAGIVSVLRNVTDLRRAIEEIEANYRKLRAAEAEARSERDRLDLVIDAVVDPILVTDPDGNVVLMNAPAGRLFTMPADAAEDVRRAVQTNDAHFSSFVANLFFTGDATRRSGGISLSDPVSGATLPVEAISGKILSEHGEVTGIVTILHDRTEELERARLYEALKQASAELERKVQEATAELVRQNELLRRSHLELEQASAAKSQFLANMSHEFRTPLNAILGYTSMVLKGVAGELTALQRRNLERIDSNANHLLSIISDILDISRIEAGKMPLTPAEFALQDLVGEVLAETEPIVALSRLKVTSEVPPGLPPLSTDRQKVKQIVINLLTNALKFTPQGSVRIETGHGRETDEITIAVTDTGIGIDTADHEKIFEDFRQADSSPTRTYTGAGLGLAICRRLATMLGGRLALESAPGRGSTFTLAIPRVVQQA